MKLKKGDKVMVMVGKDRGKVASITRVLPGKMRVLLDGVNMAKRHRRATRAGGKGQIIDMPLPVHASNVMLVDPKTGKPTRIKIVRDANGRRTRVAAKSGAELA